MEMALHCCMANIPTGFMKEHELTCILQEGVITIGVAICAAFILPNYPHTTKWLTEEERAFSAWRLAQDINEADAYGEQSLWDGIKMALRDYRLYIFVLFQHVSLVSQTFQYFFPTIVGTLGYGKIVTLWLTAPVWVSFYIILYSWYQSILITFTVCDIPYFYCCYVDFGKD